MKQDQTNSKVINCDLQAPDFEVAWVGNLVNSVTDLQLRGLMTEKEAKKYIVRETKRYYQGKKDERSEIL